MHWQYKFVEVRKVKWDDCWHAVYRKGDGRKVEDQYIRISESDAMAVAGLL